MDTFATILGYIIFFAIIALIVFVISKINGLRYRAQQTIMNKVGIGDAQIKNASTSLVGKIPTNKFLKDHPNYTEDSIKQELKSIAMEVVNNNFTHSAEQKVIDKRANDKKIEKYASMNIVASNIYTYVGKYGLLTGIVTFSDNKDQYDVYLEMKLSGDNISLTKYTMQKGSVVGF